MPPGVAAAGASVAGGVANAVSAHGAAKAQKKQTGKATGYYNQALDTSRLGTRRALGYARRGTAETVGGYDDAIRSFGGVGRGATQAILDSRTRLLDDAESDALKSGLSASPSTLRSAKRGVTMDTQRALLQLNDMLGTNMAQLQIGRGNAAGAGSNRLGSIVQQGAGEESDILQRLAGFLGNIQHAPGGANFQGIGELLKLFEKKPVSDGGIY